MFFKQTGFKPRTGSTSSQPDNSQTAAAASPPKDTGTVTAAMAGRRRSSATEKFAGLNAHKRASGDDSAAKKASFADQSAGGQGVLGQMWNNFTKGS